MDTKVLVVDDDARVLETFSRNLSMTGYAVLTALEGEQAVRLYDQRRPDIVLADVRMPNLDGFGVLEAIRARDPDAEVILVTGHGDMEMAIDALRAGASDFIPKPVDQLVLMAALQRAHDRLRLKQALHRAREELRASEEHYRAITESALVGIGISDPAETLLFVNQALAQMLGYTQAALVGQSLSDLFTSSGQEVYKAQSGERRAGERVRYEAALRHKDGARLNVLVSSTPLREADGHFKNTLSVITDITERKQMEIALRQARDQLELRVEQRTAELSQTNRELEAQIAERVRAERELQISHQHQGALNTLLRISVEDLSMEEQLTRILDALLAIPWLPVMPQGAIFLTQEGGQVLELRAQRGLTPVERELCCEVPANYCLCGRALASGEVVFSDSLGPDHERTWENIAYHGHYCVPIISGQTVLGVLTLYLQPGHQRREREIEFLEAAARTLAGIIERKRAEEALRRSQQQYAALVNSIDGIVWEADPQTFAFTFVSQQIEQILGYTVAQAVGDPLFWQKHIHLDDRAWAIDYCATATAQQRDHEFEYRMRSADGSLVWLRDIVTVVVEDGEVVRLRGVMIDVTARKQLEARLSAVYELGRELPLLYDQDSIIRRTLETAAQVIPTRAAGCSLVDERAGTLNHHSLYVDGAWEPLDLRLPLEGERGIGVAVVQQGQPINVPDTREAPRYVPLSEAPAVRSELCVPMRVGDTILGVLNLESLEVDAFTAADQQLLLTLASQSAVALENARLYTETRRNARELAALNAATQALAVNLDLDTVLKQTIVEVNALLEAEDASVLLHDSASDQLIFAAVATPESSAVLLHTDFPADAGIAGWSVQHRESVLVNNVQADPRFYGSIDADTRMTTQSLLAVPLVIKDRVIGVIEVVNKLRGGFDAHDQELLEALASSAAMAIENARLYQNLQEQILQLQKTQAQLIHSEKMAALGRLVASISHEINNPLQSIQGCLTLAGEEMAGDMRQVKMSRYLGVAEDEIERIAAIVRRVRDFYRPSKEEQTLTDLHEVLEGVLELAGKQLQHSDVVVERAWAVDLPAVRANADHLKQVFLNLVLNAIDAMPEGGTLSLRTALDGATVSVAFADTGVGMDGEIQARLFEPFFTTKPHGSGLGLSISYGIIEAHEGQIHVESQLGEGTTFTIQLPVR
jgi:two-component system NtrC family sensor kinase